MVDYVDWVLYDRLLGGNSTDGLSARDNAIQEALDNFESGIKDDPAYQADAIVNGEITPIVAKRKSTIICDIKAAHGTELCIGDIVYTLGEHWIVTELYYDKIGIVSGEMWLCNYILRFQNHTSEIHSKYCVIDDGSYSKLSKTAVAPAMSNTYKIYVSIDDISRQLYVDKRLGLGKIYLSSGEIAMEVYKIDGIDLLSRNYGKGSHLMVMNVERDVYDKNVDDIENDICNVIYDKEDGEFTPGDTMATCSIVGQDKLRIGTSRRYSCAFYNSDDQPLDVESVTWSIDVPSITIETEAGGTDIIVSVPMDRQLIGLEFVLTASDVSGKYGMATKKVRVITIG